MNLLSTRFIIIFLLINLITGTFILHFGMSISYIDAVYFVIAIATTIGFGDFNLSAAPLWLKIYGIYLMISGAGGYALIFSIIVDSILKARILEITGRKKYKMKNHIIICGFDRLGRKILETLLVFGDSVLVIDSRENENFDVLHSHKIPYVIGDGRRIETLKRASLDYCKAIIFAQTDDLANLEGALTAREIRPNVRVVLRIYDQNFARKIEKGFNIQVVLSTSSLAAPTFAQAAHDENIIDSTFIQGELFLTTKVQVQPQSRLDGISIYDLNKRVGIAVIFLCKGGKEKLMFPKPDLILQGGDELTFTVNCKGFDKIKFLNQSIYN